MDYLRLQLRLKYMHTLVFGHWSRSLYGDDSDLSIISTRPKSYDGYYYLNSCVSKHALAAPSLLWEPEESLKRSLSPSSPPASLRSMPADILLSHPSPQLMSLTWFMQSLSPHYHPLPPSLPSLLPAFLSPFYCCLPHHLALSLSSCRALCPMGIRVGRQNTSATARRGKLRRRSSWPTMWGSFSTLLNV